MITYTHRRTDWLRSEWRSSSPPVDLAGLRYAVIHYPGCDCAPDGDPCEPSTRDDVAEFLDRINRATLRKGYSFAYSSAHDHRGESWECRGVDHRNAANAPSRWNYESWSTFAITDIDGYLTTAAIRSVAAMVAQLRTYSPELLVVPHSAGRSLGYDDATPTACPSDPIRELIDAGAFNITPPEEPTMTDRPTLFIARNEDNPHEVRKGDGNLATILRSNEYATLSTVLTRNYGPVMLNPLTLERVVDLAGIPNVGPSMLDHLVGYPLSYPTYDPDEDKEQ